MPAPFNLPSTMIVRGPPPEDEVLLALEPCRLIPRYSGYLHRTDFPNMPSYTHTVDYNTVFIPQLALPVWGELMTIYEREHTDVVIVLGDGLEWRFVPLYWERRYLDTPRNYSRIYLAFRSVDEL